MSSSDNESASFACQLEGIKLLLELLSCLQLDTNQESSGIICMISACPDLVENETQREGGLEFVVVSGSQSLKAKVTLSKNIFDRYNCTGDVELAVNLSMLLKCLRLFSGSGETTTLILSYSTDDEILKLSLEDGGIITICDINTLVFDKEYFFDKGFGDAELCCDIIMKSTPFGESLQETLESLTSEFIEFHISPEPKFLKISSGAHSGILSELVVPRSASEMFTQFNVFTQSITKETYPFKAIALGAKALNVSEEVCLRINADGIMCMQHLVKTLKEEVHAFVDLYIEPLHDE